MRDCAIQTRRAVLSGGLLLAMPAPLLAASPPPSPAGVREAMTFSVWRKGQQIGAHTISFRGGEKDFMVSIAAQFLIQIGPIPVFHYRHQAEETWRDGRFAALQSHTVTNGFGEQVSAIASSDGVEISTGHRRLMAPETAHPLTHWNPTTLEGPLFNPQTGAMTHERVTRSDGQTLSLPDGRSVPATRYALGGDVEITDWYVDGVWSALRGKVQDGSYVDYRRV